MITSRRSACPSGLRLVRQITSRRRIPKQHFTQNYYGDLTHQQKHPASAFIGFLVGLGSVGWRNLNLGPCTTFWLQDLTLFFQKSAYVEKGNDKAYEKADFLYQKALICPLPLLFLVRARYQSSPGPPSQTGDQRTHSAYAKPFPCSPALWHIPHNCPYFAPESS